MIWALHASIARHGTSGEHDGSSPSLTCSSCMRCYGAARSLLCVHQCMWFNYHHGATLGIVAARHDADGACYDADGACYDADTGGTTVTCRAGTSYCLHSSMWDYPFGHLRTCTTLVLSRTLHPYVKHLRAPDCRA